MALTQLAQRLIREDPVFAPLGSDSDYSHEAYSDEPGLHDIARPDCAICSQPLREEQETRTIHCRRRGTNHSDKRSMGFHLSCLREPVSDRYCSGCLSAEPEPEGG